MAENPSRTLSLKILGDTKNLVDALNKGSKETESFGKQVGDISAKVVKSFLAIGAAVAGFSAMFAKAAAEDQAAANKLAQTLTAVTGATDKQIKAVELYITKTSLATGITDDELRPAFERLARSTQSTEKSQTLLNLALDLSAATSAPLEAVTNALGKAYDGNYTALNRLGLGIDQSLIKSKDFNAIYQSLNSTFGEFSEKRSEQAIVKFQMLQVAIQEAKERVGAALLPIFIKLGDWLLNEGVPRLDAFIAGLTGDNSLSYSFSIAQKQAEEFGTKVKSVIETIVKYKDELIAVGVVAAGIFVATKIAAGVQATIMLIKGLIGVYNALRVSAMAAGIASAFALNPALGIGVGVAAIATMGGFIQMLNNQSDAIGGGGVLEGGVGLGNRPLGGMIGAGGTGGAGAGGGGGGFSGAGGGLGGTQSLSSISNGLVSSPEDLVSRLTSVSDRISQIQFLYDTGQISKSKAQSMLDVAQKEFSTLQKIGERFQAQNVAPGAGISGGVGRGEYANVTINVMAPSVIDEDGFSRAVQNAIQNAERRGTYTGGL
jgi:hypothetical protein